MGGVAGATHFFTSTGSPCLRLVLALCKLSRAAKYISAFPTPANAILDRIGHDARHIQSLANLNASAAPIGVYRTLEVQFTRRRFLFSRCAHPSNQILRLHDLRKVVASPFCQEP